jgi:glycosyltransferase involved in cell wall biosynthesis
MTPILISHADDGGGAARAASRLQRALRERGVPATMKVRHKHGDDPYVESCTGLLLKAADLMRPAIGRALSSLQRTSSTALHSANWLPSRWASQLNATSADVVNLHWIGNETISIEDIGRIRKPIVWTLHDMWAFCGAEHLADDIPAARWRTGYTAGNRALPSSGIDLDAHTWRRKRQAWRRPMQIVTPSNWLASCVRGSPLMSDWPVAVIPNALDTGRFQPLDRAFCRQALNLPRNGILIAFGALGGGQDPNKGFDLLREAFARTRANAVMRDVSCIVFGESQPTGELDFPVPIRWLGRLHDDFSLALLYGAADVTVVPSRQENLPQIATEAQACGCPVVAFDCSGLADAVLHQRTGYLARPYDACDLAAGISWILADSERRQLLAADARNRAIRLWHPDVVVKQYVEIYGQTLSASNTVRQR